MATSSVTKNFRIKDKEAQKRYLELMRQPAPRFSDKGNALEDGKIQSRNTCPDE
jgi:hypothetical protein